MTRLLLPGIYDGTSDIKIDLRVYQSDAIYVSMVQLPERCAEERLRWHAV